MEEFKAKSHAVKKMTRKGLVETDSREGIVKEAAEAKFDGRRINEADVQLERKGAQSRVDPVDDKSAVEGAHAGEVLTEETVGKLREAQARSNRTSGRLMRRGYRQEEYVESKLKFGSPEGGKAAAKEAAQKAEAETARKKNISRFWQNRISG